jgi:hypothetical protein
MTSTSVEPREWSAGRWWTAIAVMFGLHVLLVFWLEDRLPTVPRKLGAAPAFRFSDNRMGEWLAIQDPTLFALPHRLGFSGEAWLKVRSPQFPPADWSEPARCLALDVQELGIPFGKFVLTNAPASFPIIATLQPGLANPGDFSIAPPPTSSRLRIEGDLARRHLRLLLPLPSWTNTDLLANSIVQLLVDAQGNTVSAVLLPPRSGKEQADQRALELAKAARFEPVDAGESGFKNASAGLSIGRMVFEWQTVPEPSNNALPATP